MNLVIRPPRAEYSAEECLPGPRFRIGGVAHVRRDLEVRPPCLYPAATREKQLPMFFVISCVSCWGCLPTASPCRSNAPAHRVARRGCCVRGAICPRVCSGLVVRLRSAPPVPRPPRPAPSAPSQLEGAAGLRLQCSHYEPEVRGAAPLPCVIYLHGNSGSRCDATEAIRLLLPARITVFAVDLSGSG